MKGDVDVVVDDDDNNKNENNNDINDNDDYDIMAMMMMMMMVMVILMLMLIVMMVMIMMTMTKMIMMIMINFLNGTLKWWALKQYKTMSAAFYIFSRIGTKNPYQSNHQPETKILTTNDTCSNQMSQRMPFFRSTESHTLS